MKISWWTLDKTPYLLELINSRRVEGKFQHSYRQTPHFGFKTDWQSDWSIDKCPWASSDLVNVLIIFIFSSGLHSHAFIESDSNFIFKTLRWQRLGNMRAWAPSRGYLCLRTKATLPKHTDSINTDQVLTNLNYKYSDWLIKNTL